MKKTYLLIVCAVALFTGINTVRAQEMPAEGRYAFNTYHKNIYAEGLGSSVIAGLHYDMRLNKGRMDGIGFRAGIGIVPLADVTFVTFPLEFNHLLGKKRHSLVTGIGIIPLYGSIHKENVVTNDGEMISIDKNGMAMGGAYLTLGYRFQPLRNGLMFQIHWNPVLSGATLSPRWFGVAIGYGFK